jgi:putative hydrolase of the HAD superfamily
MSRDRILLWDFDGTLAFRPGNWSGVVCEVVAAERPDLGLTADRLQPHLQTGFPWHTPEVVRDPGSAEQWWSHLFTVLTRAVQRASDVDDAEAHRLVRGVRATYVDAKRWHVFDDVRPALERLRERGWKHIVLSNHVPELPELIEGLDLHDLISDVRCSAHTGVEKPHPRAFEAVFADFPDARAGWMIGDSWRADVLGARGVGMRSILVRSTHPDAAVQCQTLDEVVDVVDGK